MHRKGIASSLKAGGISIYICKMGLVFWTSPLACRGCTSGAVIAGGVIATTVKDAAEKVNLASGGAINVGEAEIILDKVPHRGNDEIQALANITLLCANHVSAQSPELLRYGVATKYYEELNMYTRPSVDGDRVSGKDVQEIPNRDREILAALKRGDTKTALATMGELSKAIRQKYQHDMLFMQAKAIEFCTFLYRHTLEGGDASLHEYLNRIDKAQDADELELVMRRLVESLSGRLFAFRGVRHSSALRRAERFIWENYTHKISLEEIAKAAGLSAPYFSAVFKDEMGENLSSYLNRLRVEKAALMLTRTKTSIRDIAAECGFQDQSWFSKIFKHYTGESPGVYRGKGTLYENDLRDGGVN
jgi:YesN/AraC family two-component response regulator